MTERQVADVLCIRLEEVTFNEFLEVPKFPKKYSFRVQVRNRLQKTKFIFLKDLLDHMFFFVGVAPDEKFYLFFRIKLSLTHSITHPNMIPVPTERSQMTTITLNLLKKNKPFGTAVIGVGYFSSNTDPQWERAGLPDFPYQSCVYLDELRPFDHDITIDSFDDDISETEADSSFQKNEDFLLLLHGNSGSGGYMEKGEAALTRLSGVFRKKKQEAKYAKFLKRFGYSEEESLDMMCHASLLRPTMVSVRGTLYISTNYFSFFSKQEEVDIVEKIPFSSILNVTKTTKEAQSYLLISLTNGKDIQFATLSKNADSFHAINSIWRRNKLNRKHEQKEVLEMKILEGNAQFFDHPEPGVPSPAEDSVGLKSISKTWESSEVSLPSSVSIRKFLELVIRKPTFDRLYHSQRGDLNMSISSWTSFSELPNAFSRKVEYEAKVNVKYPNVPSHVNISEVQIYQVVSQDMLEWRIVLSVNGLVNTDSFRIETLWRVERSLRNKQLNIMREDNGVVTLKGMSTCRFLKWNHMHGQIVSCAFQVFFCVATYGFLSVFFDLFI